MPFGPSAHYRDPNSDDPEVRDGVDLPRCKAKPRKTDTDGRPGVDLSVGRWVCALPAGHEDYDNPRVRDHSWAQVS